MKKVAMSRTDREIKIYKIENSIYFANCKIFADRIYKEHHLKPSQHHIKVSVLHQNSLSQLPTDDFDVLNCASGHNAFESNHTTGSDDEIQHNKTSQPILAENNTTVNTSTEDATARMVGRCDDDDFILDFSAVNYIDTNGIQAIEELVDDFASLGVFVYICQPQESFLRMICHLNLVEKFDAHVFVSIEDAIKHFNNKKTI